MDRKFRFALTRRRFLATSTLALTTANLLPSMAAAQAAKYRRWEITDPLMPPRVLDSYKKGIRAMLNLPPTDPRNWYRNAFTHVFDCPHGNWWFLVWHRGYLGWLEQTLRSLSGDPEFALPYWDWTKTPRVPAAMFNDVLDPNNTGFIPQFNTFQTQFQTPVNTLFGAFSSAQKAVLSARGISGAADFMNQAQQMFFDQPDARGLTAANPDLDPTTQTAVSARVVGRALQATIFAGPATGTASPGFASAKAASHNGSSRKGILESQPHDNVHGAMGGAAGQAFMVAFLSPVDPIFFLHHGNLDRLWGVWSRRQTAAGRPPLPTGADLATWQKEQFLFFSDADGKPAPKTKAGDYADSKFFDYDYSPGFGDEGTTAVAAAAVPPTAQSFTARITTPTVTANAPGQGTVQLPAAPAAAASAPSPVAEVTLNIGPADVGRRFKVVATPAGESPVDIGGITIFGHAHGPVAFSVPIPEDVRAASGAKGLDIAVQPIEPAAGTSPTAAARTNARQALLQQAPPIRVTSIVVRAD
jgi:tyrosinase